MGTIGIDKALRAAAFAVLCAFSAAQAPSAASLKPSGFVNDFAHVLSPSSAQELEQRARLLNQQLKVQVAMVTVPSVGNSDVFDYSLALAQSWGIGAKTAANGQDKDTGILILLAIQDHKYQVQIGYGLEPYITDADAGTWMRALVPQLRSGDYGAVLGSMLDQIERTLAARMPGAASRLSQLPAQAQPRADNSQGYANLGWIGFLILIWIFGALASRGRGGMGGCWWPLIFMNMGGGGYRGGGWGGGGFGGGGGGGFGGFGGGGFGGGGAGGSW